MCGPCTVSSDGHRGPVTVQCDVNWNGFRNVQSSGGEAMAAVGWLLLLNTPKGLED